VRRRISGLYEKYGSNKKTSSSPRGAGCALFDGTNALVEGASELQQGTRMRRCTDRHHRILAFSAAAIILCASGASAEPVTITGVLDGQLRGAQVEEQLALFFPEFTVVLPDVTHLIPGFCIECSTGASVPFTQATGSFSGHSTGIPALSSVDADVSGTLSFTGATNTLSISRDPFDTDVLVSPVTWSGSLVIRQPNRILFSGTLSGSGIGSAVYANTGTGDTRLDGYEFRFSGVAATPEPASLLLVGTGVAWLAMRRRKSARADRAAVAV
jgi:hypothetical protein